MMPSKLKAIKSKGLYHIKTAKKDGFENQGHKMKVRSSVNLAPGTRP